MIKKCLHTNWGLAGYPEMLEFELGIKPRDQQHIFRVCSIYEVYCKDCHNFVNLLTGKIINDKGLIRFSL